MLKYHLSKVLLIIMLFSLLMFSAHAESLQVGSTVLFGRYPQTTDGEPVEIEWLVLSLEPDQALLLSCYALDAQPSNEVVCDVECT